MKNPLENFENAMDEAFKGLFENYDPFVINDFLGDARLDAFEGSDGRIRFFVSNDRFGIEATELSHPELFVYETEPKDSHPDDIKMYLKTAHCYREFAKELLSAAEKIESRFS